MTLRSGLDDLKRNRNHPTRFPGERRSTDGLFSGDGGRLVHVAPDGALRDFGYPLSNRAGIDRSRLGLRRDGDVVWFDELAAREQAYVGDTTVRTVLDSEDNSLGSEDDGLDSEGLIVEQYDRTLGDGHCTHVAVRGTDDAALVVAVAFAPENQESRIGRLRHGDAVEAFHRREHDYLASATGIDEVVGRRPVALETVLGDAPEDLSATPTGDRYEDTALGGDVVVVAPLRGADGADPGVRRTTVATLLTDRTATDRSRALDRVRSLAADHDSPAALAEATPETPVPAAPGRPRDGAVAADLRALALLAAPTGARIAGPEFDPFYAATGGYGYTWFRDDAEISRHLLAAERALGLGVEGWHARSAAFYCRTQRADGTWPHRVWPHDGALAPGWANGRLETGDGAAYQADQTASVVAFLAAYRRSRAVDGAEERARIDATLADGIGGLDATLDDDGLPQRCQNAWENATGRFAHTAAAFLGAYAEAAGLGERGAGDGGDLSAATDRARRRADAVFDALDDLWVDDRGVYARRLNGGDRDAALDASTLALVDAHRSYARLDGASVGAERLDRLAAHVERTLDGLYRDPEGPIEGLARFEGDDWRRREQAGEKIWTVSTGWGANAAAHCAALLADHGRDGGRFERRARELLALLLPGGALVPQTGYLPEQLFDDGTPDSATPLGWSHGIRLATIAELDG